MVSYHCFKPEPAGRLAQGLYFKTEDCVLTHSAKDDRQVHLVFAFCLGSLGIC